MSTAFSDETPHVLHLIFQNFSISTKPFLSFRENDVLKDNIRLAVMGKPALESREDTNFKINFRRFWTITSPLQGTEKLVITTKIPQKQKFLKAILLGETKIAITDRNDFECRDKSKVIAYFRLLELSRF